MGRRIFLPPLRGLWCGVGRDFDAAGKSCGPFGKEKGPHSPVSRGRSRRWRCHTQTGDRTPACAEGTCVNVYLSIGSPVKFVRRAAYYDIIRNMAQTIAVYPGTFDPMTKGHFDLIARGARLYNRLLVAVAATSVKNGAMFSAKERVEMIREDIQRVGLDNVEVKILDTLLVDFCRREGVSVVLRGVRVYSDFEYEFQMALTNRRLAPEIETLFMMPSENLAYVTASTVREISRYGGDTAPFVTAAVQKRLEKIDLDRKAGTKA